MPFSVSGRWWIPSREERKVAGTLTFDDKDGGQLALIGALRDFEEEGESEEKDGVVTTSFTTESIERAGRYPRLHGQANNRYYTLEDSFQTQRKNALFGVDESQVLHVNQILEGAAFDDDGEPLKASGASFGLDWLAFWLMESGLKETHTFEGESGPYVGTTLSTEKIANRTAQLKDGSALSLRQHLGFQGDRVLIRSITQDFSFRLDYPTLKPIKELIEVASDLQDLVSIAVNKTAAFDVFSFWHPEAVRKFPDGKSVPLELKYHVPWNARPSTSRKAPSEYDMAFTFPELGGMEGLIAWFQLAAVHRSELGRVMATTYSPSMYVSDRLLNRVASLEAFDRGVTGHQNTKLLTRLERCASLAGDTFGALVGDVPRWLDVLNDERDDVAHNYGRRLRHETSSQYYLAESAYWLFILCMLAKMPAPASVFEHIARNPAFTWLAPKVQSVL